ncbi:hypothetical protein HYV86_01455 [Candidatus Woesearchaeota archaeon]|nr:hypothetical protein [Candidatus Woesearchaeota archaeon]
MDLERRDVVRAIIFREGREGLEYFLIEKRNSRGEWYHTNLQGGLEGLDPLVQVVVEVHEEIGVDMGHYFIQTLFQTEPYQTVRGPEKTPTIAVAYGLAVLIDEDAEMIFEKDHRHGGWHTRQEALEKLVKFPEQRVLFDAVCERLERTIAMEGYAKVLRYSPSENVECDRHA